MPIPDDDPLVRRQFAKTHWAAGVQPLRRDRHFRAEAKLTAIGEARAGVDIHRRRIHLGDEALRVLVGASENAVGVCGAVRGNVRYRFVEILHNFQAQHQ